MSNVVPIRTLSHAEEVYSEVTTFLRSPLAASVDYVDLPEAVLSRWPAIKHSHFEATIAWQAVLDEIERRANVATSRHLGRVCDVADCGSTGAKAAHAQDLGGGDG